MLVSSSLSNLTSIIGSRISYVALDFSTVSTPSLLFSENDNINNNSTFANSFLLHPNLTTTLFGNLTCARIAYNYVSQKPLFNIVRHVSNNLNRFFILPAIILNLCAFYILRRTRMNRSSSIAFYMQALALCDVAFFALRVLFDVLSSPTGKHILSAGLCRFLFLMVNAVNYCTVWLIAAMNADKFLAVCLPLRVSDLLSRKKAYAVVIAVIICSMLVASVHASQTVLKDNGYCWLKDTQAEKLVFILDAFFCCFVPFIVISILNAAIFLALLRARREASHLHESTNTTMRISSNNGQQSTRTSANTLKASSNNTFRQSMSTRSRVQSQNLQITIMLITISISFFILTLPNAIYYLLIFLRVLIESWKAVKCDAHLYRNLDVYVRTSAVVYLISNITSDLMHVVNFFLYFISGARFRTEFRRLIIHQLCRWCCKNRTNSGKDLMSPNERSFIRSSGVATVRTLTSLPGGKQRASNISYTTTIRDKQKLQQDGRISSTNTPVMVGSVSSTVPGRKTRRSQSDKDDKQESDSLLRQE